MNDEDKKKYKKAMWYLMMHEALSNAGSMIDDHSGTDGGLYEDMDCTDSYKKACNTVGNQLTKRADVYYKKYLETGIKIDFNLDLEDD